MKTNVLTAFKGMAMGMAEVVPGVSGGTIAFITGIYERLINCIKSIGPTAITGWKTGGLAGLWRSIDGTFLLFLLLGMAAGVIVGVFGVTHLLEHQPLLLWSFFFGLIIASAIYVGKQVKGWSWQEILALVLAIGLAWWITIASPAEGSRALWFVFFSGAIAICALILPGISGSFILLLLGMYTYIIPLIKETLKSLDPAGLIVIVVFALGCLLGLVTFSRVLSWLFRHFHNLTMATLTGFMIGSLNKIWPWRRPLKGYTEEGELVEWVPGIELDKILTEINLWPATYAAEVGDPQLLPSILCMLFGFAIVFLLEKIS